MNTTIKNSPEVVLNHKCLLGEGPVWDVKNQRILWVDILNGEIHQFFPQTKEFKTYHLNQLIGSIALCKSGKLLVALQSGIFILDETTEKLQEISNPENHLNANRFNDGKCDPAGRFWVGSMSIAEDANAGNLYMLDKNYKIFSKIEHLTIPNGMAWSQDNKYYYFIDSPTKEIVSYQYDIDSGDIRNKKIVIKIAEDEGYPDGMTIDTEGMLWVALWSGWSVSRYNPFTGKLLLNIKLPVANVTSCTFGGTGFQDLYITTAKKGLNEDDIHKQPLAGSLFVIRKSDYKGIVAIPFSD